MNDLDPVLQRLDRRIAQAVTAAQEAYGPEAAADNYRGLYIGPQDVGRLLARQPGASLLGGQCAVDGGLVTDAGKVGSRFGCLQRLFKLDALDLDLILLGLTPELDVRYERLYGYLHDDVTRRRPSIDLAMNLLCPSFDAKLAVRNHLAPSAPLMRQCLLELIDEPAQPRSPLLKKIIKVDDRIVDYLLGLNKIDSRLRPFVGVISPDARLKDLVLPADFKQRLELLSQQTAEPDKQIIFYFQGSYGVGKQSSAEAFCRKISQNLLAVDGEGLLMADQIDFDTLVGLALREARLQTSALYWDGFDRLLGADRRRQRTALLKALTTHPGLTFFAGTETWEPTDALFAGPFIRVMFPRPAYTERLKIWASSLNGHVASSEPAALQQIANKFRFSGGQIKDSVATAANLSRWRDPADPHLTMQDLYAACRLQSNRKLTSLAQKIRPRYRWKDIILPHEQMAQLQTICSFVKHRALVFDQWGFDRKLSLGKGINALFAGPPGTGKTMAAEIIARELKLDLYKIDLSTVVSKYIGETEKNLAQIFSEAETSNAILFFDEADALFGKRSEVKDSHDRYANIEISYLLQKMEEFEGVSILATNLRRNMDGAFVRRMAFSVTFPFPEENNRARIWRRIWPSATPRAADLDLDFMARRFKLAGGNIKNIALAAAFLAADDGQTVSMAHLIRATKEELHKMGKACVKSDFGPYYELIAGI